MISKHYNENSNKREKKKRHLEKPVCVVDYKHNMVDLKDHKFNMY